MSALVAAFSILGGAAWAADPAKELTCREPGQDGRRYRVCEMKEITVPAVAKLSVDASPNGGIEVKAWSQAGILVRARVEAWGDDEPQAAQRLREVKISTAGGQVSSDGPKSVGRSYYSVSYEVFVPGRIDLSLKSVNGGISVADVHGALESETTNGGLKLARISGRAKCSTVNGGVAVELAGKTWDGEGLDVRTANGGVRLGVPEGYSARLEAKTVNGGIKSDIPGTVRGGAGGKQVSATLGSGGPLLKVETTNGGVHVQRNVI